MVQKIFRQPVRDSFEFVEEGESDGETNEEELNASNEAFRNEERILRLIGRLSHPNIIEYCRHSAFDRGPVTLYRILNTFTVCFFRSQKVTSIESSGTGRKIH